MLFGSAVVFATTESNREVANAKEVLKKSRPYDVFVAIGEISRATDLFEARLGGGRDVIPANLEPLRESLTALSDAYMTWLHEQADPRMLALLVRAATALRVLDVTRGVLASVISTGDVEVNAPDEQARLRLTLQGGHELGAVVTKLTALRRLYDEALLVVGAPSTYPLMVVRLEVGSIDGDFLGFGRAVEFVRDALFAGARYLHRRFTSEGRIASLSEQIKVVDQLLALSERMTGAGLEAADVDQRVAKSAAIIGDQLQELLGDQRRVVIDDTEVYVGEHDDFRAALTSQQERRLLTGRTGAETPDADSASDDHSSA